MLKVQYDTHKPDKKLNNRLNILASHFRSNFRQTPSFFVRVPGRVNLIGEHIDYCGYSVCPMAIEHDILVAISKSDEDELQLINIDDKYPNYEHKGLRKIKNLRLDENHTGPSWHKYFLCGVKGALEVIPEEHIPKGLLTVVWGNIPPNAGLSSSSALVSAALLATVHICQYKMSKEDMATVSAKAETYIGTQGGGMDQAIAFLGKAGSAKLIKFNPLCAFDVALPKNAVFVIAHSLVDHNKASNSYFNTRVLECRFAAQIIAKKNNIDWCNVPKLIDVQKCLNKTLEEMTAIVMANLKEEHYTLEEICQILETSLDELKVISNVLHYRTQKFKLKQRALHVFQEAARVAMFQEICELEDMDESTQLCQLGNLMTKSHQSLKNLYECSHPRIDTLVTKAIESGAFGARLTGAGWGGFVIAITTAEKVNDFMESLKSAFYYNNEELRNTDFSNTIFKTEPKEGAGIIMSSNNSCDKLKFVYI
ncbi:PREDICTED: N-acetylgalactosamine kinase isoform X1 [Ceratosolen solmsi marchali]|uniref:N-acetylgalactosamine kinase isoform X1 n=1 Tax=Ceratosolen solmsi marchali TaxID=326594 RepID=A0AAJ6VMS6_9HYME|nr:PREDICTED: N-acetylgalactosamine kinase isoform X1 [Ceratosolen solmsi marchali]